MPTPASRFERAALKLTVQNSLLVSELARVLREVHETYAVFSRFIPSLEELESPMGADREQNFEWRVSFTEQGGGVGYYRNVYTLVGPGHYRNVVQHSVDMLTPGDQPVINSISLSSPGWIEVIGRLNPLQAIKEIIVVCRDWREAKRRARIENDILEMELFRQRVALLQSTRHSQTEIKSILQSWLWEPVEVTVGYATLLGIGDVTLGPVPENRPRPPKRPPPAS
jgi:hypothetical protein